jgi:putative MATE family efflux protein
VPLVHTTIPHAEREPGVQDLITGDGPLMPVIIRLAWPVVIMMYLQGAYNIIDTIWVGQLLGKFALAGIATGGFVLWSIFGLTSLVSVGISAVLARRVGEGNLPEAEYVAAKGIQYALFFSIAIGAMLWFLVPALFGLMGTGAEVTELGSRYLRVILLGCPLIFLSFTIQRIFQAGGDTVTPMWLMFFTLLINTALDPVLMLGLFGLPKMGVAGAALATVIARLLMVVSGIWLLRSKLRFGTKRLLKPVFRYIPHAVPVIAPGRLQLRFAHNTIMDWPLFKSTLRIGLPNAVSQVLFPFVYMIITRLPAAYGPQYIAALRIGHTVEGISFFLALGVSIAAATCVGQNLGANKPVRAARAAWIATGIVVAILFVFSVLFFTFSRQVGSVFSPDLQTIVASATYLEILAFSQVFMGIEMVLEGAFSGAGNTVPAMVISVPLNLARIPMAYVLAGTFGLGINGVWWSISGSSIAKGLVMVFWFSRGRWKRKKV